MLQQTTVATVAGRFEDFVAQFPDVRALADAQEKAILSAWRGLGHYRRAANLHRGAQFIVKNHGGRFPGEESALKTIPGIGEYTAAALFAIGRNRPALPLDTNLKRVLARYLGIEGRDVAGELQKRFTGGLLLSARESPRPLMEALMDLGRTHCKANRVQCHECPLADSCLAHKRGRPLSYGRPLQSPTPLTTLELLRVVVRRKDKILAYPKKEGEWLSGQWELPTFILRCQDRGLLQYPRLKTKIPLQGLIRLPSRITRYRIQNHILCCNLEQFRKKFPPHQSPQFYHLHTRPCLLSSTTLKILDKIRVFKKL